MPGDHLTAAPWPYTHHERVGPGRTLALRLEQPWLFEGTEYFPSLGGLAQQVSIGNFTEFGRGLVIDGQVQIAEKIDALYTQALVLPAALASPSRADWMIIGGGDGATAREALAFADTRAVLLVDISEMVIRETQRLIPSLWAGCQHDPRLAIRTTDAWQVFRAQAAKGPCADIIIFDLTDPEPEPAAAPGPAISAAEHLYSEAAFGLAARCLRPDGVIVVQSQELSALQWSGHHRHVQRLRGLFKHVHSYRVFVEFFGYWESFIIASNAMGAWSPLPGPATAALLAGQYRGGAAGWCADWHHHLFALPPDLQQALRNPEKG
jgi:spermidine synthase